MSEIEQLEKKIESTSVEIRYLREKKSFTEVANEVKKLVSLRMQLKQLQAENNKENVASVVKNQSTKLSSATSSLVKEKVKKVNTMEEKVTKLEQWMETSEVELNQLGQKCTQVQVNQIISKDAENIRLAKDNLEDVVVVDEQIPEENKKTLKKNKKKKNAKKVEKDDDDWVEVSERVVMEKKQEDHLTAKKLNEAIERESQLAQELIQERKKLEEMKRAFSQKLQNQDEEIKSIAKLLKDKDSLLTSNEAQYKKEVEYLKENLELSQKKYVDCNGQNKILTESLAQREEFYLNNCKKLEKEISNLQTVESNAQLTNEKLLCSLSEIEQLKEQIQQSSIEIATLNELNDNLKHREIELCNEKNVILLEKDELQAKLGHLLNTISDGEKRSQLTSAELKEAFSQLSVIRDEKEKLAKDFNDSMSELKVLKEREDKHKLVSSQLEEALSQISALELEKSTLASQYEVSLKEVKTCRERQTSHEKEVSKLKNNSMNLLRELDDSKQSLLTWKTSAIAEKEKNSRSDKEMKKKQQLLRQTSSEASSERKSALFYKEEHRKLESQLIQLQQELEKSEAKLADSRKKTVKLSDVIATGKTDIQELNVKQADLLRRQNYLYACLAALVAVVMIKLLF